MDSISITKRNGTSAEFIGGANRELLNVISFWVMNRVSEINGISEIDARCLLATLAVDVLASSTRPVYGNH